MKTLLIIWGLLFIYSAPILAQDQLRIVGEAKLAGGELIDRSIRDVNGQSAAAIKIKTDLYGFSIEANNGVIKINTKQGEYVVFLSPEERVLSILKTGYLPLRILLPEVGIRLKSGQMWEITVTGDKKLEQIPVNFIINPEDAILTIDGNIQKAPYTALLLPIGNREITISKAGFGKISKTIDVSVKSNLFQFELQAVELQVVSLLSEPVGAKLFIDGVENGQTNKGLFLFPGTYLVKWSLSNYLDIEKQIEVKEKIKNENKEENKNDFLVKLVKNTGVIKWDITPKDAIVKLNKEVQFGTSVEKIAGNYLFEVEKSGYLSQSDSISLKPGKIVNKSIHLEKATALLIWDVTPKDAIVKLNKEIQSRISAEKLPGKYIIEVEKSGYLTQTDSITLKRGETVTKVIKLEKSTGSLAWNVSPSNAQFSINKVPQIGKTQSELAPGLYFVEITADGFDTISENIEIKRGDKLQKSWTLTQQTGRLQFLVEPIDASVKLIKNSKEVMAWNGLKIEKGIPIGNYEILISLKGYRPKRIPLTIEHDKKSEIIVKLEEIPALEVLDKKGGIGATFQALVFPGWGLSSVTGGEQSGKWFTISSLTLLGTAYLAETQSKKAYKSFLKEGDFNKAENFYSTANQWRQTALGLASAGVGIWIYNAIRVGMIGSANDELKKQLLDEQRLSMNMSPTLNGFAFTINF